MKLTKESYWSLARLGYLYFEFEKLERARLVFEGLTVTNPDELYAWSMLGDIARREGRIAYAVDVLRHALTLGEEASIRLRLAECLILDRRPDEARLTLEHAPRWEEETRDWAGALLHRVSFVDR